MGVLTFIFIDCFVDLGEEVKTLSDVGADHFSELGSAHTFLNLLLNLLELLLILDHEFQ